MRDRERGEDFEKDREGEGETVRNRERGEGETDRNRERLCERDRQKQILYILYKHNYILLYNI